DRVNTGLMLIVGNADLRLPLIASAILLSMVKAIFVVLAVAVAITTIAPENAPSEADGRDNPSLTRTPLSSITQSQPIVPLVPAAVTTHSNSDGPPQAEPSSLEELVPFTAVTARFEPAGCGSPVEDYSPVQVGERVLSVRTFGMLQQAGQIYGGSIDLTETAIVSIDHPGKLPMPDPHRDRGVLDISVKHPQTQRVLYGEIEGVVRALRAAGFAAWLRDEDELYPGSEIHVHAVAIGDRELSRQALDQLLGKYGYFAGRKGYFDSAGATDPHGGPIICSWMREAGFGDLRELQTKPSQDLLGWQDRLRTTAQKFVTGSREETQQVARAIGFQRYGYEDPSNMCGPLAAAILQHAGLLPSAAGPVTDLANYWLADPLTNGRPWSLFPSDQYRIHRFTQSIERFDFSEWPLYPGDFLFTYSGRGAFSHMFVVTEVDGDGRSYTVTNQEQANGDFWIERVLLYDPMDPDAGVLRSTCENCGSWRRRTGLGGFDVLRRTDLAAWSPSVASYTVRAGDTLPAIADQHRTTADDILRANALNDLTILPVGYLLTIPAPSDQDPSSKSAPIGLTELADSQLATIGSGATDFAYPTFGDDLMISPLH
ncbi:MAG: LysM peptidoglycan-binding domain-containing protein, partial [Chloroflexi bacterium]|nr:LysM peptidoglycan-binding domain-containing protein [Chloroflexota bacterium]